MDAVDMPNASLRRMSDQSLVKRGHALAIAKEYVSFSVARKQQYFISYSGRSYSGDEARRLLDELQVGE
jgi:hypothetical protein